MFLYDGLWDLGSCMHTCGVFGYHGLLLAAASLGLTLPFYSKKFRIGNTIIHFRFLLREHRASCVSHNHVQNCLCYHNPRGISLLSIRSLSVCNAYNQRLPFAPLQAPPILRKGSVLRPQALTHLIFMTCMNSSFLASPISATKSPMLSTSFTPSPCANSHASLESIRT